MIPRGPYVDHQRGAQPEPSVLVRTFSSGARETVIRHGSSTTALLQLPYHDWDLYRFLLGDEGGGP